MMIRIPVRIESDTLYRHLFRGGEQDNVPHLKNANLGNVI
jgi:hypothetical protein